MKTVSRFAFALVVTGCAAMAQAFSEKTAPQSLTISQIQKFPGYIEVTYDRPISAKATDLLFVIDDSGSMQSHQRSLSNFSQKIIESFVNNPILDLQIGVITTSMIDWSGRTRIGGELVRKGGAAFVTRSTPDAVNVLKSNMLVGTEGGGTEIPFAMLLQAITPEMRATTNQGFFRSGANLKVVLYTDAEDQSAEMPDQVLTSLRLLQTEMNPFGSIAVDAFIADSANQCPQDDVNVEPRKIHELIKKARGRSFPICGTDVGVSLSKICDPGTTAIEIPLPLVPDLTTLKVTYGSQVIPPESAHKGWVVDSRRQSLIVGSQVPWTMQPEGTRLKVRFVPLEWQ